MLDYNEVKERKCILFEGEPYEVLTSHVFRKQQRKPVNATKLKNLISGRIVEHSFHAADKVEEAELDKKEVKYLYSNRGEHWFANPNNPAERFKLGEEQVGEKLKFMKQNMLVTTVSFGDQLITVDLPIKVELKVTEAAPGVKGDTAKGGMKLVTVETGASIPVPLFVNEGDRIVLNTETGEYVERAS